MLERPAAEKLEELVASLLPGLLREVAQAQDGRLYRTIMSRVELPLLRHVLHACGGNQLRAARLLGINRNTLRKRLRLLGLLPVAGPNGDRRA
jgi:two-component system nitrogen regulation response regulator GlnG